MERHRRAIAECLAGTKHIRLPVHPYPLSFDLTHGPYTPTVVSGGKCIYSPNYPHATGIIPLTSPSPLCANARDQLYIPYPLHFTKWPCVTTKVFFLLTHQTHMTVYKYFRIHSYDSLIPIQTQPLTLIWSDSLLTDYYLIWLIRLLMLTQQLIDTYSACLLMIH